MRKNSLSLGWSKGKLICIDLDGTLCGKGFPKREPKPIKKAINLASRFHTIGAYVVIYTARQEKYYPETKAWLVKNRVPFVAIAMRHKPQAFLYIDDCCINIKELLKQF